MNVAKMILISKVMTEPLFTAPGSRDPGSWSGVFLSQDSYLELSRLADNYFGLMSRRPLKFSYMLITRDQEHITKGVGKYASLKVDRLVYDPDSGILSALVAMKNNFTCNQIPHIILSGSGSGSGSASGIAGSADADKIISSVVASANINKVKSLPIPIKVHGKIGIMTGERAHETSSQGRDRARDKSPTCVAQVLPQVQVNPDRVPDSADTMKISIDTGNKSGQATGALYNGETVFSGPRGGRYILKNGRKKYLKEDETPQSSVSIRLL